MLERAIEIAVKAHSGQVDIAWKPYVLNLIEVEYQYPEIAKVILEVA